MATKAKSPIPKKGFYCQLPDETISEIKKRAKGPGRAQWKVIYRAIHGKDFGGLRRKARKAA